MRNPKSQHPTSIPMQRLKNETAAKGALTLVRFAVVCWSGGRVTSALQVMLIALLGLVGVTAHAQDFAFNWFTINGGGGTSAGGVYAISGTIGQPDAGRMTGGHYTLEGGFWGMFGIPSPELAIINSAGTVIVSWPL
jgi:hypothetical protein